MQVYFSILNKISDIRVTSPGCFYGVPPQSGCTARYPAGYPVWISIRMREPPSEYTNHSNAVGGGMFSPSALLISNIDLK